MISRYLTSSKKRNKAVLIAMLLLLFAIPLALAAPPVFDAVPPQTGSENNVLQFTAHAVDPENEQITYGLTNPPVGAAINPQTGLFSWTPNYQQASAYTLTLTATAGNDTIQTTATVQILNTNRPPEFAQQQSYTVAENSNVQFSVYAVDSDGDTVTYSAASMPQGSTFLAGTGLFLWAPNYQQSGIYLVQFIASDGQITSTQTIQITVTDFNTAPTITVISPQSSIDSSFTYFNISTNTNATCKYASSDISYDSMTTFEKFNGLSHSSLLTGLSGTTTFYIKCKGNGGDLSTAQKSISVAQGPKAEIILDPDSPVRPGLVTVTVQTTTSLQSTPSLYYFFDESPGDKKFVSLEPMAGSSSLFTGHIVIPKLTGIKTGTFEYHGIDVSGAAGSEIKNGKTFIADDQAPLPPKTFTAKSVLGGIDLIWYYTGETIKEYKIYKNANQGVTYNDYYTSVNGTSFLDTNVAANTPYYYKITAIDQAGNEGDLSLETMAVAPDMKSPTPGTSTTTVIEPRLSLLKHKQLNSTIKELERTMLDLELVDGTLETNKATDVITALKLRATTTQLKSEVEAMRNELKTQNIYEIGDEDVDRLVEKAMLKIRKANQSAAKSVTITDSSESIQALSLDRLESLAESISQKINFTKSQREQYINQFKDWNNKLKTRVIANSITLTYLDGRSEFVTLVIKEVTYEGSAPAKSAWVLEKIPKNVAEKTSEIQFDPQPTVIETDPLVKFKMPENDLQHIRYQYLLNKRLSNDEVKGTMVYLQQDADFFITQYPSKISSFAIIPKLGKGSLGMVIIVIGTLAILGLGGVYLFLVEKNKKVQKAQNEELQTPIQPAQQDQQTNQVQNNSLEPAKNNKQPQPTFYVADGRQLKSVPELLIALESISSETFSNHVTNDKNDFCRWLHEGLGETDIAFKLYGIKDKIEFKNKLLLLYSEKVLRAAKNTVL
ncbi:MAG: putative Ig domain-containing protein [Nanoarchaeota archaeon]